MKKSIASVCLVLSLALGFELFGMQEQPKDCQTNITAVIDQRKALVTVNDVVSFAIEKLQLDSKWSLFVTERNEWNRQQGNTPGYKDPQLFEVKATNTETGEEIVRIVKAARERGESEINGSNRVKNYCSEKGYKNFRIPLDDGEIRLFPILDHITLDKIIDNESTQVYIELMEKADGPILCDYWANLHTKTGQNEIREEDFIKLRQIFQLMGSFIALLGDYCHGDLHWGNMSISNDGLNIMDFENFGKYGSCIDIGQSVFETLFGSTRPLESYSRIKDVEESVKRSIMHLEFVFEATKNVIIGYESIVSNGFMFSFDDFCLKWGLCWAEPKGYLERFYKAFGSIEPIIPLMELYRKYSEDIYNTWCPHLYLAEEPSGYNNFLEETKTVGLRNIDEAVAEVELKEKNEKRLQTKFFSKWRTALQARRALTSSNAVANPAVVNLPTAKSEDHSDSNADGNH